MILRLTTLNWWIEWNDDTDEKIKTCILNSTDLSVTRKIGQIFFLPQNNTMWLQWLGITLRTKKLFSTFLSSHLNIPASVHSLFFPFHFSSAFENFKNTCYLSELLSIVRLVSVQFQAKKATSGNKDTTFWWKSSKAENVTYIHYGWKKGERIDQGIGTIEIVTFF